ncbi:MAG TPA: bacteriohemerythrin [Planctomycetota bacterium]|jgi:hemerythrin
MATQNRPLLEWTDALSVGVQEIDRQHKELIARTNQLAQAIAEGQQKDALCATLKYLQDYVIEHFGTEERVMFYGGYAEYLEHRRRHSDFVMQLAEFGFELEQAGANPPLLDKLYQWLATWVMHHISKDDVELCSFIRNDQRFAPPELPPADVPVSSTRPKTEILLAPIPQPPRVAKTAVIANELKNRPILEVLAGLGLLSANEAAEAQKLTGGRPETLGPFLQQRGLVSSAALCHAWSVHSGLAQVEISALKPSTAAHFGVPPLTLLRFRCIPFDQAHGALHVAVSAPLADSAIRQLEQQTGGKVRLYLAPDDVLSRMLDDLRPRKANAEIGHTRYRVEVAVQYAFRDTKALVASADLTGKALEIGEDGLRMAGPLPGGWDAQRCQAPEVQVRVQFTLPPHDVDAVCRVVALRWTGQEWEYELQVAEISEDAHNKLVQACIRAALWTGLQNGDEYRAYRRGTRRFE